MLADCVDLFCNLARVYPEQLSSQFLWFLHAYAYFTPKINSLGMSPAMDNIRVFLEPKWDRPPPSLDITRCLDLIAHSGVIEDAIRACYTQTPAPPLTLVQNIFVAHCERAVVILREVVEKSAFNPFTFCRVLYIINAVLSVVSDSNRVALRQVLLRATKKFRSLPSRVDADLLMTICLGVWRAGLLDEALEICEQAIEYFDTFDADSSDADRLYLRRRARFARALLLCDMGRFPDAIETMRETKAVIPLSQNKAAGSDTEFLLLCILETRFLQRLGRKEEALSRLRRDVAASRKEYQTDGSDFFNLYLHFLLTELATTWAHAGHLGRALKTAEQAVADCFRHAARAKKAVEEPNCILVHSLTSLSNCLATVGKDDQALKMAQEAASIYTHNAANMWQYFLYTIRREELGANAFHALSQRLATSGDLEQALLHAEKATALYRQLVQLAPRHLPTLATSLRNLASILWSQGCQEQATTPCEEAVHILRKIVESETYFLPALAEALDQLSIYLTEKGDDASAFAAAAECTEVRRQFAALPPQPEFLFDKVEMEADSEDEGIEEWEMASEAECDDESDTTTSLGARLSGIAYANISELPSPAPTPEELETALEAECDDKLDAVMSIGARLSGTAYTSISELPSPAQAPDGPLKSGVEEDTVIIGSKNEGAMSPITKESPTTSDTTSPAKSFLSDILSKPIEVRVSMRSTPMDILWWILLCFMGMGLVVLSVALMVL
ncbi:hypothetical protein MVEN_00841600 [Mycena venus]|uniref:Tetratricopeptide repeat protein n=1 Tax=Mycena venus TaxID=2733690 RepID=A0A8H6YH92_9AGAR|nr:hypothetical protein MVEN_00841600 [Mycena venus]